jgi:hypothetical protein
MSFTYILSVCGLLCNLLHLIQNLIQRLHEVVEVFKQIPRALTWSSPQLSLGYTVLKRRSAAVLQEKEYVRQHTLN